jgi:caspase 7
VFLYTQWTKIKLVIVCFTAAKYNHDDVDCFACAILSHGDEGVIYGKDGIVKVNDLFAPFKGDVCPKLAGKPKFFVIQVRIALQF